MKISYTLITKPILPTITLPTHYYSVNGQQLIAVNVNEVINLCELSNWTLFSAYVLDSLDLKSSESMLLGLSSLSLCRFHGEVVSLRRLAAQRVLADPYHREPHL